MRKKRKNYTPEEKFQILKSHLVNKRPVSEICDQYDLQPTVFYRWQKQFFEKGASVFQSNQERTERQLKQKIEKLEEKIVKKNEVLGE